MNNNFSVNGSSNTFYCSPSPEQANFRDSSEDTAQIVLNQVREMAQTVASLKAHIQLINSKQDRLLRTQMLPIGGPEPSSSCTPAAEDLQLTDYLKAEVRQKIGYECDRLDSAPRGIDSLQEYKINARKGDLSIHKRHNKLFKILYGLQYGEEALMHVTDSTILTLKDPFLKLGLRIARLIIYSRKNGEAVRWSKMPQDDRRYFAIVYEDVAYKTLKLKFIHRCIDCWAAKSFIWLGIKAHKQCLRRARIKELAAQSNAHDDDTVDNVSNGSVLQAEEGPSQQEILAPKNRRMIRVSDDEDEEDLENGSETEQQRTEEPSKDKQKKKSSKQFSAATPKRRRTRHSGATVP